MDLILSELYISLTQIRVMFILSDVISEFHTVIIFAAFDMSREAVNCVFAISNIIILNVLWTGCWNVSNANVSTDVS